MVILTWFWLVRLFGLMDIKSTNTILTSFNHRNSGLHFKEVNLPSSSGSGRGFCRISQFFIATNKLNSAHQAKVIDNIYKQAKN